MSTPLGPDEERKSFGQLGIDSVVATALVDWLWRETAVRVPVSALFDHPSIAALAAHLSGPAFSEPAAVRSGVPPAPIAVVGLSGRFPGAENAEELWRNLAGGVCSVGGIPADRSRYWDLAGLASVAEPACRSGAFLKEVDRFDPLFFGISPKEAAVMDPQQRIFLEEAWKAIEDAGYAADRLSNHRCGVYAGVMVNDYHDLLTHAHALTPSVHELMGTASFLPARIAYHLNLRGPAIAVDTASSSSLVAVDMACRALAAREIDMALAGGATLYLTQKRYTLMERAGMLTATACRPFDDAADGMMPGEAVAVVVLKRLDDALADGDSIYGVITASGVNQAGKTNGITAPSVHSQAELMAEVYRTGKIDPATIQYVEAHGTGTKLGDPVEAEALMRAFGAQGQTGQTGHTCRIGSLKANIGHSFAAAGAVGLIKVLLALKHRAIPPQIHFEQPHRKIPFENSPFRVNTALEPWERGETPRRAAVCGVGFSGTNAHLVVEEAPGRPAPDERPGSAPRDFWITLSARTPEALARKADDLLQWLETGEGSLADLSFTLNLGRSGFEERLAFLAADRDQVRAGLRAFLSGEKGAPLFRGRAVVPGPGETGEPVSGHARLGEAWVDGAEVDWAAHYEGLAGVLAPVRLHLPAYPLERERYWYDLPGNAEAPAPVAVTASASRHDLSRTSAPAPLKLKKLSPSPVRAAEPERPAAPLRLAPVPARVAPVAIVQPPQPPQSESGGIASRLRALVAKTLYLDESRVSEGKKFSELGFDSILAVDLAKAVRTAFGIPFSAAKLYDHPTVEQLALHVAEQLAAGTPEAAPAPLYLPVTEPAPVPQVPVAESPAASAPGDGDLAGLTGRIRALAAATLYVDESKLGHGKTFTELGLDSILAVELAKNLSAEFGVPLSAALLYEHPTPRAMAEHLGHLPGRRSPEPETSVAPPVLPPEPTQKPLPAQKPESGAAAPAPASRQTPSSEPGGFEPVAVVGFSGRFPGAPDAESFWRELVSGRSAIAAPPPERWPGEPDAGAALKGGFLDGIDEFDAPFFRIARAEAEQMDPQHRLFLLEAWKALEHAGYSPRSLAGRPCGAFLGIGASDYYPQLTEPDAHSLLGNISAGLTARLAYLLDWSGPCIAVDTACASSLSALHLACLSLARRECDLALAGGVHVASSPRIFTAAAKMGLLSPRGECRTFDASADGFVISEGAGAVILKRLDDAVRDGDRIHAVIRGSGTNQDGAKNGLTAPKAATQSALQRSVYAQAGVHPETIDYLEVHGMSSALSDEIELLALKESFGAFTRKTGFCALGSLKPNIGHPLAASGIACLIKVILALKNGQLPPVIGVETVNPALELEKSPFVLNTGLREWTRREDRPRRAAINGLSATGTNCHVVIEEYRAPEPAHAAGEPMDGPALLVLSARDKERLHESAANLLAHWRATPELSLREAAFTLQTGREAMEERLAFTARSPEEAKEKLSRFLKHGREPGGEIGNAISTTIYRGRVETPDSATALLISGEEGRLFLSAAIRNRAFEKLARLWIAGIELDWSLLYEGAHPRRTPLSVYPFARERYWLAPRVRDVTPAAGDPPQPSTRPDGAGLTDLADLLRPLIAGALRCPVSEIGPDSDLFRHGFGSLYALRVAEQFEAATGIRIPARAFFERRTLRELAHSLEEREELAAALPARNRSLNGSAGKSEKRGDAYPDQFDLSEGQKALWSLHQANPSGTAYHLPVALRWEEPLDRAALCRALAQIAEAQPALRTRFPFDAAGPVQRVGEPGPVTLEEEAAEGVAGAELIARLHAASSRPFDLERGPLWRVHWFSTGEGRGVVLLVFHHLIFDGHSLGLLLEELDRLYAHHRAHGDNGEFPMPVAGAGCHPYVAAERRYLESDRFPRDREWWLARFPDGFAPLALPRKRTPAKAGTPEGDGALFQTVLSRDLVESLDRVAASGRTTLQCVLLTAYQALLADESAGGEAPAVAVPADLRPSAEFEASLGYFVNLLPVNGEPSRTAPFRDGVRRTFDHLLEAFEHRQFPFRQLVSALAARHGGTVPLAIEAAFYFLTWPTAERRRLAGRFLPGIHQSGEFDLVFEVMESADDWRLNVKYRPAAFDPETVERLAGRYRDLLERVAADPGETMGRLLDHGRPDGLQASPGRFDFPSDRAVHELIEAQAARTPDAIAAHFGKQSLTYRELDGRANRLAHHLAGRGAEPGSLVGVMLSRSLEMLVGLLAVWKAGAAYVPLDPAYPAERIEAILSDAKVEFLLTQSSIPFAPGSERPLKVLEIDREADLIRRHPDTKLAEMPRPDGTPPAADPLAYVIYTSGSTGRPKGVQIGHRSLAHFLWCMAERPGCRAGDRVVALTTICFDIAALELFLPLVTGASVEILAEETVRNGLRLKQAIETTPVTLVQATPATWKMLLAAELGPIPNVKALCGGEAWDAELARQLLPLTRELWNMYGPTETTVWSSILKVEPGEAVRLGDPIGNTQFYVLDEELRQVPKGEIGELFIGGDGLAKGYLHRPDLTRERFIPHPSRPGEVIYRTGDLVRYV